MIYYRTIQVEFNHCDPAGIVFYPRCFEMTNSVVENFFREVVRHSYADMMSTGHGVPTARLGVDFHSPSRLGEVLDWRLSVTELGGSSVAFMTEAWCADEHRMTAKLVLVWVKAGRPMPWPKAMRQQISAFMEAEDA